MTDDFHIIPGTPFKLTGRFYLDHEDYIRRRYTNKLVIHCSDTPPSMDTDVNEIRRWHLDRDFSDVGYNFVVRRNGDWERGRPTWAVGAGVAGHNAGAIHVCLVGGRAQDSKKAENNFTELQMQSLELLIRTIRDMYPDAQVIGHHDLQPAKDCPSFPARQWWLEREAALKHTLVG